MASKKNTDKLCNITLKNVPCDLKVFFIECANENERSLSGEIISILKEVKKRRIEDADKFMVCIPNSDVMDKVLK